MTQPETQPTTDEARQTYLAKVQACEAAVNAVLAEHGCAMQIFQRMIDGQLHPVKNMPLIVLPIPIERNEAEQ